MNITITEKAREEIINMTKDNDKHGRVIMTGQKCSGGLTFGLSIDKQKDDDNVVDIEGIKLIINKDIQELVGDINIDYEDEGLMMGFSVK